MIGHLVGLSDPLAYTQRLEAQHGSLAFDVGANAGWVTGLLAERFDKVIAVEPAAESYAVLAQRMESHPNVVPMFAACTDHVGTVRLREASVTAQLGELVTGDTMPDWGETVGWREVDATTVDRVASVYGLPDLVKIDTEGHELAVLHGARHTLEAQKTSWFVEVHAREYHEPILAIFATSGFYKVEIVRHPAYAEGSMESYRHFYVIATP